MIFKLRDMPRLNITKRTLLPKLLGPQKNAVQVLDTSHQSCNYGFDFVSV